MRFRALLAVALSCASLSVLAKGNVSVQLTLLDHSVTGDVQAELTFTNMSRRNVKLLNWFMPEGEPDDDVFSVFRNGKRVSYMGPHIKRAGATAADFIVLAPGESVSRVADIGAYYDLTQSGDYTIQYQVSENLLMAGSTAAVSQGHRAHEFESAMPGESEGLVRSNEASAFLNGRKNRFMEEIMNTKADAVVERGVGLSSVAFSGRCSATQQSTILSAVSTGSTMANGAVSYLNGSPSATTRYTTWFGTYSSANWNQVKGQFANIKDAFDNKPLTIDCGCKKSYYAYVYPNQPYKIYVCRAFWNAPLSGTDSKGGTLVHELSHFDVIAGTDDWAYGQTAAKNLALTDPTKARNNADSHEYFAENTPALP